MVDQLNSARLKHETHGPFRALRLIGIVGLSACLLERSIVLPISRLIKINSELIELERPIDHDAVGGSKATQEGYEITVPMPFNFELKVRNIAECFIPEQTFD